MFKYTYLTYLLFCIKTNQFCLQFYAFVYNHENLWTFLEYWYFIPWVLVYFLNSDPISYAKQPYVFNAIICFQIAPIYQWHHKNFILSINHQMNILSDNYFPNKFRVINCSCITNVLFQKPHVNYTVYIYLYLNLFINFLAWQLDLQCSVASMIHRSRQNIYLRNNMFPYGVPKL